MNKIFSYFFQDKNNKLSSRIKEKVTVICIKELPELQEYISNIVMKNTDLEFIDCSNIEKKDIHKSVDGIILPVVIDYSLYSDEIFECKQSLNEFNILKEIFNQDFNKKNITKNLKKVAILILNAEYPFTFRFFNYLGLYKCELNKYKNLFEIFYDLEDCYSFLFNYQIINNKLLEYIGFNEGIEEIIQKV